jgi:HrpA-like RNA helicase
MNLNNIDLNDPLDINGKNNNFINNNLLSDKYKELSKKWSTYPVYSDKSKLKEFFMLLDKNQVLLVVSGTGSGKTVIIPKLVMKYMYSNNNDKIIAITNPKIITTISNAEFGALTLDVKLGEEVGYKYKGSSSQMNTNKTKLLYCTDGTITATILNRDPLLMEYNCIIIDEAHERQVNIDLLLYFLRDIVIKRPDFKVIIMSATINPEIFRNYFSNPRDGIKFGEIMFSGVSNFEIKQNWSNDKTINRQNYIEKAVNIIYNDILNKTDNDSGDIIVFAATENDLRQGCQMLKRLCPSLLKIKDNENKNEKCDSLYCVEVYAKMNNKNKELAIDKDQYKKIKDKNYKRKIIFATNVAESSLTFDGLTYVIDSGYELAKYFDSLTNSYIINKQFTTQAQIKQRIGRVGRTRPGIAYHLYDMLTYKSKMLEFPQPSIKVQDLTEYILAFYKHSKTLTEIINIMKNLITPPSVDQFCLALYKLNFYSCVKIIKSYNKNEKPTEGSSSKKVTLSRSKYISIINKKSLDSFDNYNGAITTLGHQILKFKGVKLDSCMSIIYSYYMECHKELIDIIGIFEGCDYNISQLFIHEKNKDGDYDIEKTKNHFKNTSSLVNHSDHLTLLYIYNNHYKNQDLKYLNIKLWSNIEAKIEQINECFNTISENKFKIINEKYKIIRNNKLFDKKEDDILYSLILGFKFNMITRDNKDIFTSVQYLENSKAKINKLEILNNNIDYDIGICTRLNNNFGKKSFDGITLIPNHIIKTLKNEKLSKELNKYI